MLEPQQFFYEHCSASKHAVLTIMSLNVCLKVCMCEMYEFGVSDLGWKKMKMCIFNAFSPENPVSSLSVSCRLPFILFSLYN